MNSNERQAYRQTARWKRLAAEAMLAAQGYCEVCAAAGIATPARDIHHLNPEDYGREDQGVYEYPLVAMCHPCHQMAHPGWAANDSRVTVTRDIHAT